MGTIMAKLPTPIPLDSSNFVSSASKLYGESRGLRDETAGEDGVGSNFDGSNLDNHAKDEDAGGDNNTVLSGDDFSEGGREEGSEPGTELENGREPALLGLIRIRIEGSIFAHVWRIDMSAYIQQPARGFEYGSTYAA
jgi:hypothetical protein